MDFGLTFILILLIDYGFGPNFKLNSLDYGFWPSFLRIT